jgi:hypothetical protein
LAPSDIARLDAYPNFSRLKIPRNYALKRIHDANAVWLIDEIGKYITR